jgi:uncharacterized membrane protein YphA (DoxX/SURF4 family)
MQILRFVLQVIVALGLFNVWLVRFYQGSAYRGGESHTMREEFEAYGLPAWSLPLVGGLKLLIGVCLLAGFWLPLLIFPASLVLCVLMLGALAMHLKVSDPVKRSLPAALMLGMSVVLCLLSKP